MCYLWDNLPLKDENAQVYNKSLDQCWFLSPGNLLHVSVVAELESAFSQDTVLAMIYIINLVIYSPHLYKVK